MEDKNRCWSKSRSGAGVSLTQEGQKLRQRHLPGEELRAKVIGVMVGICQGVQTRCEEKSNESVSSVEMFI